MGLDMYLHKKTYVKNWKGDKTENKHEVIVKGRHAGHVRPERLSHVVEEVMYWRKANQVHNWFVQNCVTSNDWNGEEVWVTRDNLAELLDICEKVLAGSKLVAGKVTNGYRGENGKMIPNMEDGKLIEDDSVAKELLPSSDGFFFGSTEYNEWYLKDVEKTRDCLKALLAEPDESEFYYSASW